MRGRVEALVPEEDLVTELLLGHRGEGGHEVTETELDRQCARHASAAASSPACAFSNTQISAARASAC